MGESLAGPQPSSETDTLGVRPHLQSQNEESESSSKQPAITDAIPYLSYLTEEPEDEAEEEGEDDPVPKPPAKFHNRAVPLPVTLFGNHVEKKHANNNQPFMIEFEVAY